MTSVEQLLGFLVSNLEKNYMKMVHTINGWQTISNRRLYFIITLSQFSYIVCGREIIIMAIVGSAN